MKNFVTGASGFIGSHLISKLENYTAIPHKDIDSFKVGNFDNFFFLSSYGNLASQTDEDSVFKANITDLIAIAMQVKNIKFDSFVFISTSSVRLKTQTTYSRCKRAAEEILLAIAERHKYPICIIRPFSITGVGEQQEHLIPTLIRSCLTGEKMNFVPNASHDFIDVDDVVDGILNLSEHHARGIYELGMGKSYTNQQVLELVEQVTGKKANINIVPSMRDYDTKDWVSNNFRARGYGWLPKKTLKQSITEMVEYEVKRG